MRIWRNQSGVTLIELVVVMVILGLLAAALYPALGDILQVTASKGASEQVAGGIRLARQYAITRGNLHCIRFGAAPSTSFTILQQALADPGCDTVVQSATTVGHGLAVIDARVGATAVQGINFTPVGSVVDGSGNAVANPVRVSVDTDPTSYPVCVIVSQFGGVRVVTGTCPAS